MGIKRTLLKYDSIYFVHNSLKRNKKKIAGKNNFIESNKVMLNKVSISIKGDNNKVEIGTGTRLSNCKISILGNNHSLVIHNNCIIRNTDFYFEDSECNILIGKGTSIEGAQISSAEDQSEVKIGDDCMFSQGIHISTTDSHSIIDKDSGKRINQSKNISIGNHVWLGAYCRILKGVNIFDNSVIAIGSIVTRDVPTNSIVAGIPAKVIKTNIDWKRERI